MNLVFSRSAGLLELIFLGFFVIPNLSVAKVFKHFLNDNEFFQGVKFDYYQSLNDFGDHYDHFAVGYTLGKNWDKHGLMVDIGGFLPEREEFFALGQGNLIFKYYFLEGVPFEKNDFLYVRSYMAKRTDIGKLAWNVSSGLRWTLYPTWLQIWGVEWQILLDHSLAFTSEISFWPWIDISDTGFRANKGLVSRVGRSPIINNSFLITANYAINPSVKIFVNLERAFVSRWKRGLVDDFIYSQVAKYHHQAINKYEINFTNKPLEKVTIGALLAFYQSFGSHKSYDASVNVTASL